MVTPAYALSDLTDTVLGPGVLQTFTDSNYPDNASTSKASQDGISLCGPRSYSLNFASAAWMHVDFTSSTKEIKVKSVSAADVGIYSC